MNRSFPANLFLIGICLFTACSGKRPDAAAAGKAISYDLNSPDDKMFLPYEIEEISGLSYLSEDKLLAIQDEQAIIYTIDMKEEKIASEQKFGKNGDYEGVEVVGEFIFAVRSDGTIYKTSIQATDESATEVFDTPLSHKNDVEGLAYDVANNRLLLACKGISGIKNDIPGSRAIYAFNLSDNTLAEEPVFLLKIDQVNAALGNSDTKDHFRPSGIAVHPVTGQIYIIASVGKVLIVLNKNGSIDTVTQLASAEFKQPEGICFSPNGDMFISNEGKGGRSTILRFNYAKNE
ncbi:hypothetical protein GXP67_32625 [Rhodocytophaga rosea]|uniref:SdiA-regulated family protein n=1 Tax=Rhodocytophaga rosea TaxID=2704465 RepID=A0A6C0GSG0_9BACT|nr:SdiA-regulated domain-containing protein [Rhodocytophaga rosea]QHT71061.1 hypothetical protein GXP67_32625 [Rhodocytophaga rosea]